MHAQVAALHRVLQQAPGDQGAAAAAVEAAARAGRLKPDACRHLMRRVAEDPPTCLGAQLCLCALNSAPHKSGMARWMGQLGRRRACKQPRAPSYKSLSKLIYMYTLAAQLMAMAACVSNHDMEEPSASRSQNACHLHMSSELPGIRCSRAVRLRARRRAGQVAGGRAASRGGHVLRGNPN